MKILIEGEKYSIATLQSLFDDPKFYYQKGIEGQITSVGYYHSFERKELIFMLPKVFMRDTNKTIFGSTKDDLINMDDGQSIKHDNEYGWVRHLSILLYNSLLEFRRRKANTFIVDSTKTFDIDTNLKDQEYSYLDLILSFVNFYKKNKNYIIYKQIESSSNQVRKTKWEKTIRKTLPILKNGEIPIYFNFRNKKKIIDNEEELITYFFSILRHFNLEHKLFIKIDKSFKILTGRAFKNLQKNGLTKLKKIKYRYFNDTLKRMYRLCEVYLTYTNLGSPKKKKEEFLSTRNYNLVFEDMVDKLFSDDLSDTSVDGVSLNKLKHNEDGKIIDHIYEYQSLVDTSNIFYIGDSKYYKSDNEAGKISKYKQFTYAKNVIQFNIDLLNRNGKTKMSLLYRDNLTEGYNITPNFFVYGYIDDVRNYEDHLITLKSLEPLKSYHYNDRLFDRDTLFVHQYKINFLYALKAYSTFNKNKLELFRQEIKRVFRDHFLMFFNDKEKCNFEFFESLLIPEEFPQFINENFKRLNGKCYCNLKGKLILAVHNEDKTLADIMNFFKKSDKLE